MPLETNADKAYMNDLPKVSFRVITDDKSVHAPAGVQSEQSRSYGYNDFSDFQRPEHYIRYIEPIESELAVQVEYDMDEQDQEWLDAVNAERKKDQSGPVSYEVFEIIMDKLEKEWFNLSKTIPQPAQHLPAEDSRCAVCDDGEGENSNAIVFCDGCNLAVHQDCYGVPYIPEGQWLCRKCTVSPENPVSCVFCPNEGGAFKQTTTGHWAHLLCSIWIPETGLGNAIYMEPVEGVENVPKNRWKLVCSLCREKTGACIQCDNRNCFTAFHVTCARQVGLLSSMKSFNQEGVLKAYCHKHLPADARDDESETGSDFSSYSESGTVKYPKQNKARRSSTNGPAQVIIPSTKKSAQAHSKSFRPGPPIIPKMILDKVLDYIAKVVMRKRQIFVERLCRYWSLKREARRGAPLLKRLHLEPWTASSASRQQTEAEKAQKLKFIQMLRNDLEKVRMLAELVRKREKEKLRQVQVIKDVVDSFIFPYHGKLRVAFETITAMDRQEFYLNPVNRAEAPDYFDIIKEPMCWLWIDEKLEKNVYIDVADFKRDIMLVLDNAMIYNPKDNPYHRHASRIKKGAEPILAELDSISDAARAGYSNEGVSQEDTTLPVGDLEPISAYLSTLLQASSGPNDPPQDHLGAIFAYELEKPKEPTSPPPPKPNKAPRKSLTSAERQQRQMERENAAKERPAMASRSTRATRAAEKTFAQEAGLQLSSDAEASKRHSAEPREEEELDARSRRRSMRGVNAIAGPSNTPSSNRKGKRKAVPNQEVETQPEPAPATEVIPEPETRSTSLHTSGSTSPTKSSSSTSRPKSQPGVVRIEPVIRYTDKERRERERNLDIVIDDVGSQDAFKRFNVGWVLPEGSKRKRAERTSESMPRAQSTSSSRKPPSTSTSKARASTTPRTLRLSLSPIKSQPVEPALVTSGSGSDLSSPPPSSAPTSAAPTPRKSTRQNARGVKRKALSEVEDDAPRESKKVKTIDHHEESFEKDEELTPEVEGFNETPPRDVEGEEEQTVQAVEGSEATEVVENPDATEVTEGIEETQIAEETEVTGEPKQVEEEDHKSSPSKVSPSKSKGKGRGKTTTTSVSPEKGKLQMLEDAEKYSPGILVWAKAPTFPYFPALIMDPEDKGDEEELPQGVIDRGIIAKAAAKSAGKRVWLVQFFDSQYSYDWVTEDKMDMMFEDDEIDAKYLAGKERGKPGTRHKKPAIRKVRKAFQQALQSMHSADEEGAEKK